MKQAYRLVVDVGGEATRATTGRPGHDLDGPADPRQPDRDHRTINGKKLDLFYDGTRLRLVAWRTPSAVYWVSNTLSKKLTNDQMLPIAGSLTRLGGR